MMIAQEGGVGKAASKLRLGQSTLSTQLAQFEDQLGLKLFERRLQRLHLTEAGRIALQYAREIFKLGDEMTDALHDRRHVHRISVQIGVMDAIPKSLVADILAKAQQEYDCSVTVSPGSASELLRALKAHEIDLGVFNHQPPSTELARLKVRMAGRMPIAVLGAKKYTTLREDFPRSLDGQAFILPQISSRLRCDLDSYFKLQNIQVDLVVEAQDSSLQAILAVRGSGLLPIATSLGKELQISHDLEILGVIDGVFDELWLLSSERRIENPVAGYLFEKYSWQ